MRCSSPKGLSSQGLASIPRGLRTPVQVQNLEPRSDFSIFSDLENRVSNVESISKSILPQFSPKLQTLNSFTRPMRRGRKVKSQGFVGLLTAASNH
ncbi:hypothetical protein AVEN_22098-1 [Araneus ventricosus]|uniref:Uncharacterized protein n=1 Tax=Araneus ventricosus TaxID=182803 RepID=A0A4Y2TBL4_ARAVE|nr:hypothetical protein AVEN_22098-1 [Araneus ventricosus]